MNPTSDCCLLSTRWSNETECWSSSVNGAELFWDDFVFGSNDEANNHLLNCKSKHCTLNEHVPLSNGRHLHKSNSLSQSLLWIILLSLTLMWLWVSPSTLLQSQIITLMSGLEWNKDRLQIAAILCIYQLLKRVLKSHIGITHYLVCDTDVAPIW